MPKISSLELKSYEYVLPRERAYGQARGLNFRRACNLIAISTDDGVTGYGEAGGPPLPTRGYFEILKPFFLGQSIFDFEIIATQVYNRLYHFGYQGHHTAAMSGMSMALTDAMGKTLKVSAHDLLGGKARDRFPAYATTGYFTTNDGSDFETQLSAAKDKFTGAKIKIGAGPASDLQRV